ncbi:MAG: lysophospholipid acyltransferase family protein [Minicystis sp.]
MMIPASKQRLFNAWFASHARGRIQRTFAGVRVRGLERMRALSAAGPILVISNHTSWWDPLVILHASEHLIGVDGHALMDAKNLRRLPFFALVGAFGVDLDNPADGAAVIRYAARLLDRAGRLVWVFPQGRERPITERPLGFRPGSAEIARVAKHATTVPAALRYEFAGTEKPELYLSFGEPVPVERDAARGREAHEQAVEAEMDGIDRAVRGEVGAGFEDVYRSSEGVGGDLASRALAFLTGPVIHRPSLPAGRAGRRDRS